MNLQENYKRLFKGKPMSNDASLITEAVSGLKHRYEDVKGNLVITGKVNGKEFKGHLDKDASEYGWVFFVKGKEITNTDPLFKELVVAAKSYIQADKSIIPSRIPPHFFLGSDDTSEGDILKNKDFRDTVETIADGARGGSNMTDDIVDELGDFYDGVYDSNDQELIDAYDDLRSQVDGEPNDQAEAANKLLDVIG